MRFRGTQIRVASSNSCITDPDQEISMRSKLAISTLVVASLFGATAIASAQTDPAQPARAASGEGNAASRRQNGASSQSDASQDESEPHEVRHDHRNGDNSRRHGQIEAGWPIDRAQARRRVTDSLAGWKRLIRAHLKASTSKQKARDDLAGFLQFEARCAPAGRIYAARTGAVSGARTATEAPLSESSGRFRPASMRPSRSSVSSSPAASAR